jgi:hypothetical protein
MLTPHSGGGLRTRPHEPIRRRRNYRRPHNTLRSTPNSYPHAAHAYSWPRLAWRWTWAWPREGSRRWPWWKSWAGFSPRARWRWLCAQWAAVASVRMTSGRRLRLAEPCAKEEKRLGDGRGWRRRRRGDGRGQCLPSSPGGFLEHRPRF